MYNLFRENYPSASLHQFADFFQFDKYFLKNSQKILKDEVWKIMLAKTFDCSRKWVIVS